MVERSGRRWEAVSRVTARETARLTDTFLRAARPGLVSRRRRRVRRDSTRQTREQYTATLDWRLANPPVDTRDNVDRESSQAEDRTSLRRESHSLYLVITILQSASV